jgi:hypothetical protein
MITRPSCYATAGRDAKIDWKALSKRIGHADVAFTMKQYVQTDLEADRQVANTLAELIIGGTLASPAASTAVASLANPLANHMQKALSLFEKGPLALVAGADLNPRPLGYEPYDVCLYRLASSLVAALTSEDEGGRSYPARCVSLVSSRPAASCAQIRAQSGY